MPNPTITPATWASGAGYDVTNSDWLAIDVAVNEIDAGAATFDLTVPAGATVRIVRDPVGWGDAGTLLRSPAAWQTPVTLGNWTVTVTPGATVTALATVDVEDPSGNPPIGGIVRLLIVGLGTALCRVDSGGGTMSIERVLAAPTIINPQVTSVTPVREADPVAIGATVQATHVTNPGAPLFPLTALPAIASSWSEAPANTVSVGAFVSTGSTAHFTAPVVSAVLSLGFDLASGYDLDASGALGAAEPRTIASLTVQVNPVNHGLMLVLDRSGSMSGALGSGSKWDGTVRAAHAVVDLFRSFRRGAGHKAGIITFENDSCHWTTTPTAPDDIELKNPATGLQAASTTVLTALESYADIPQLTLGTVQTCTPIGDALLEGLAVLKASMASGDKASMILLTDGYENSGLATLKTGLSNSYNTVSSTDPYAFGKTLVGDRLFAIGVGSTVDANLLNGLGTPTIPAGAGFYRLTTDVKELLPTFADMLGHVVDAHRITPTVLSDPAAPPDVIYFSVGSGERVVAFLVPWDGSDHNLTIAWRLGSTAPGGSFDVINPAGTPGVVGYWRRQFHGLMTIDLAVLTGNPVVPGTEFRVQHLNATSTPVALTSESILAMVDLMTRAEIQFDKREYATGEPIGLTCTIRSHGAMVVGAVVGVDAARPGEGLGTFLATNSGLYKEASRERRPTGPDPDGPKGDMFKWLLHQKQLDDLPVITPPAFQLTSGANDGVYTNQFTDTTKEGTYTFRFRVEGTLPDGSRFSRLFVRSTWVGVKPAPGASPILWTALTGLTAGTVGHLLTITPKSAEGEYLGPFWGDQFQLAIANGTFSGALVDNLDGSYSQAITYQSGDVPIVTGTVSGVPIVPTGPTLGSSATNKLTCLLWALAALIVVLFIVVLILLLT